MSDKPKVYNYKSLRNVVTRLRDDLRPTGNGGVDFVLLYAYNGTGKTRLSMEFKEAGKRKKGINRDTLYFNAFTEDLFHWDNDLSNDAERHIKINPDSKFFSVFQQAAALEDKIFAYLERYADFNFKIDYADWKVVFSKEVANPKYRPGSQEPENIIQDNIKVSRGEENIFIWCFFLAICEMAIDGEPTYDWVRYFYIDDPISSLDDNNAIAVACDLAKLLKKGKERETPLKTVISSHHGLFFNVMCNELKKQSHKKYFLYRSHGSDGHSLQATDDSPFFHHVAILSELKKAMNTGNLYTHHFNSLRSILEKTANYFGSDDISFCLNQDDKDLHARALNLLSHGAYSIYDPKEMVPDNKELFKDIFTNFMERYEFELP
ncbi:MAG: anticodon nuclease [Gammaproteobacteria bacterium HGW-Gammaproteobacteria-1]|jgi:hypothetical protein|nr:MAG: anticodon nuclease [Gammaproteobacteria bacterium HGW-Gammaproteobacteria-1]